MQVKFKYDNNNNKAKKKILKLKSTDPLLNVNGSILKWRVMISERLIATFFWSFFFSFSIVVTLALSLEVRHRFKIRNDISRHVLSTDRRHYSVCWIHWRKHSSILLPPVGIKSCESRGPWQNANLICSVIVMLKFYTLTLEEAIITGSKTYT